MEKVTIKRYSEPFRQHVVREYEGGASISTLNRKYGIRGQDTVLKWIKRYGLYGLRHEVMTIQTVEEQNRIRLLEARVRELEAAVAQLALDKLMLESTLAVVEAEYGIDVKKSAPPSSATLKRK
jgi:transposase